VRRGLNERRLQRSAGVVEVEVEKAVAPVRADTDLWSAAAVARALKTPSP
jgi:hypothetical protein